MGVAERGRGRQRVVRAGTQAGVLRRVAGVWRAGGVLGQAWLRVGGALRGQRGRVRFHLELEQIKVVEVLHGKRAGGQ